MKITQHKFGQGNSIRFIVLSPKDDDLSPTDYQRAHEKLFDANEYLNGHPPVVILDLDYNDPEVRAMIERDFTGWLPTENLARNSANR